MLQDQDVAEPISFLPPSDGAFCVTQPTPCALHSATGGPAVTPSGVQPGGGGRCSRGVIGTAKPASGQHVAHRLRSVAASRQAPHRR